jgi:hypothetical protein
MFGDIAPSETILTITNDGGNKKIKIDDYEISVKELVACIKAIRAIAKEEYPEEFI